MSLGILTDFALYMYHYITRCPPGKHDSQIKIHRLRIFKGLTLNMELISRVRQDFLYFHECETPVAVVNDDFDSFDIHLTWGWGWGWGAE